jgi:hypothetical protein
LAPAAALHALLSMRWSYLAISRQHTAGELAGLAALARALPVCRVFRPDGLESLPGVVDAIRSELTGHAG